MNPDIFEFIMLICFGAAWPLSIYKLLKTKKSHGKSLYFLAVLVIGYISGIFFEYFGENSKIIWLYILNAVMVSVDFALTVKYRKKPGDQA